MRRKGLSGSNTALISLIASSRILYGMSQAKALPPAFGKVLPGRQTPWISILVCGGLALVLMPLGKIEQVASISSLATMIAFFAVNIALITLRYREPDLKRPFRSPLRIGKFPLCAALGAFFSLVLMFQFSLDVYLICGLVLGLVALFFAFKDPAPIRFAEPASKTS